jgi:hypothetical protein
VSRAEGITELLVETSSSNLPVSRFSLAGLHTLLSGGGGPTETVRFFSSWPVHGGRLKTVAIIGPAANDTLSVIGKGSGEVVLPYVSTPLEVGARFCVKVYLM